MDAPGNGLLFSLNWKNYLFLWTVESRFSNFKIQPNKEFFIIVAEVYCKRFVLSQNENVSLEECLLELERLTKENVNAGTEHRFYLDAASLNSILHPMDTEYDSMALKAVVFALHSRSETYSLGIKPDRAVQFLSKVISVSDENEKALEAAADIFQLRTRERIEKVESKIQVIDHKLEKKLALLSEKRKCDIEGEKNALKERLENLQSLQKNDSASAHKKIEAKRKIARDLIDSNRVKKRKLGAGAPSLLDSENEEFITRPRPKRPGAES